MPSYTLYIAPLNNLPCLVFQQFSVFTFKLTKKENKKGRNNSLSLKQAIQYLHGPGEFKRQLNRKEGLYLLYLGILKKGNIIVRGVLLGGSFRTLNLNMCVELFIYNQAMQFFFFFLFPLFFFFIAYISEDCVE